MRTIDPIEHIRQHRGMYLPGGRVDPLYLANSLTEDARLLGADRVQTARAGEWWWVAADRDWIAGDGSDVHEVFCHIVPFPQAGANSMRSEVKLMAFADAVLTVAGDRRDVIRGQVSGADPIWNALPTSQWARIVAFRVSGPTSGCAPNTYPHSPP
jgi:hypothetical protein